MASSPTSSAQRFGFMTLGAVFVSTVVANVARQSLGLGVGVLIGLGCLLLFFAVAGVVGVKRRPR